jgi:predicted Zn-dependent protease
MKNEQQKAGITTKQKALLITIGFRLYQQGRLRNARKVFKGLAVLDRENAYVQGILGSIDQKEKLFNDAIKRYSAALETAPSDLSLLTNRAECFLKVGKIQEAGADLKKVIELDKGRRHPAANRSRLLVQAVQNALQAVNQKGLNAFLQER